MTPNPEIPLTFLPQGFDRAAGNFHEIYIHHPAVKLIGTFLDVFGINILFSLLVDF